MLFLAACRVPEKKIDRVDLPSDFEFSIGEHYSEKLQERTAFLRVRILEEVDCAHTDFSYSLTIDLDSIHFTLYSISTYGDCGDTLVMPEKDFALNSLRNGTYELKIDISDAYDIHGTITNRPNMISIHIPEQYDQPDLKQTVRKVPDRIVWGRISINDNQSVELINNILKNIDKECGFTSLPDGEYTPFFINNGHVTLNATEYPPKTSYHRSFIVKPTTRDEFLKFVAVLDSIRTILDGNGLVEAYSWDGRKL